MKSGYLGSDVCHEACKFNYCVQGWRWPVRSTTTAILDTRKSPRSKSFRCELNAYHNLREFGVCDRGFVPAFYGHIDRVDPSAFHPPLKYFADDKHQPSAILLGYLPCAERLNCENYSEYLFRYAVEGINQIHNAFVHHHDIYPKNMLVVCGTRIVWVDFDVATTFSSMGPCKKACCDYELVENFGKLLVCIASFT